MSVSMLEDGDIGLVRFTWLNPICWFAWLAWVIDAIPKQNHYHALIFYWVPEPPWHDEYPWTIEAGPLGVRPRRLTQKDVSACNWFRVNCSDAQKQAALQWAVDQRGSPYDVWNVVRWAWEILCDWVRENLGRKVRAQEAYVCTELVVEAYRKQGVDLVPGKPSTRIFPEDIANSQLTEKVQI